MSEWFMRLIIWFMVHLNGNYLKIMLSLSRNYEDIMSSLVRFWLGALLGKRSPQNNPTKIFSNRQRRCWGRNVLATSLRC